VEAEFSTNLSQRSGLVQSERHQLIAHRIWKEWIARIRLIDARSDPGARKAQGFNFTALALLSE
jgi:hypothetical protein